MRLASLIPACFLASLANAGLSQIVRSNFTIIDNTNNAVLTVGTGDLEGLVEVVPNATHQWYLDQSLLHSSHVIRDATSHRFIHFDGLEEGSIGTLSETAATLLDLNLFPNVLFGLNAIEAHNGGFPVYPSVEPFSETNPRRVLRLRKSKRHRGEFSFVAQAANVPKSS